MRTNSGTLETKTLEMQRQLRLKYPDLTVSCDGKRIYIRGSFPIIYEGKILDRYQIAIEWSESDKMIPLLIETGGRIPRIDDRHITNGGGACLLVPEEWLVRPQEERTVLHYLDGPVRNYFIWQSLYERGQSPRYQGRSHAKDGLIEAYGEMLGLKSEASISRYLEYLSKKKIKPHWPCPCGSGNQIRRCDCVHFRELQSKIPRHIAKSALARLTNPTIR
jgi:hypothetical protein